MVKDKLLKASLHTFRMQLTRQQQWRSILAIRCSKEATGCDKSRDEAATCYDSIDWRHYGEVIKKLSDGWRIQISKYTTSNSPPNNALQLLTTEWMDDALPAISWLWEDTTHMLTCTSDARYDARKVVARLIFQQKCVCTHPTSWLT
jgi:hypothetical protein